MKAWFYFSFMWVLWLPLTSFAQSGIVRSSDHSNLQEALDALPELGGILYLAPGNYEIAEPLVLRRENVRIEGSGASTHIINKNESGKPALRIRPDGYESDSKKRMWRVQLSNFRISGNPKSGSGVHAQGIQEIYIHGLSVDHNGAHGIYLENCYEDPRISDSILTYNGQAGLNIVDCHDIVVSSNQFEENQDGVRCIDSFNLCMNANNLDDHLRHGVVIENTYGSVLSGNMIEECQGSAVILDRDCYGITISSNVIAHEFDGGIDLRDAHGCAISANTFVIVHKYGVRVGPGSGRITITGNSFANSYMGDGRNKRLVDGGNLNQRDVGTGILLDNTSSINISGNSFSGMSENAVEGIGDCSRILISSNLVTDMHLQSTEKTPAFNLGDPNHTNLIKDNIVQ
ncbi:MAG: right-handed parallel beta-helix repeat-containing protein [Verrucomicrobia bacterium]|nr:right-handed parallel beta-helix repeat-containing protein [Verrucomicrobiota bacterium]MDA1068638.1 right-handed parallel beta-helix repeat-containing protein [Verrucomicrobiota bacterium]